MKDGSFAVLCLIRRSHRSAMLSTSNSPSSKVLLDWIGCFLARRTLQTKKRYPHLQHRWVIQ